MGKYKAKSIHNIWHEISNQCAMVIDVYFRNGRPFIARPAGESGLALRQVSPRVAHSSEGDTEEERVPWYLGYGAHTQIS